MTIDLSPEASAGLFAAGIALWFAVSVAYRVAVGRPIFSRPSAADLFIERWASGRAGTGLLARMSTSKNCLQVQVDREHLRIHPHFPFTLGFLPEIYAMDQVVPLRSVRSAVILGGRGAQAVEVRHQDVGGQEQVLQLLLKDAEGFIRALGQEGAA